MVIFAQMPFIWQALKWTKSPIELLWVNVFFYYSVHWRDKLQEDPTGTPRYSISMMNFLNLTRFVSWPSYCTLRTRGTHVIYCYTCNKLVHYVKITMYQRHITVIYILKDRRMLYYWLLLLYEDFFYGSYKAFLMGLAKNDDEK